MLGSQVSIENNKNMSATVYHVPCLQIAIVALYISCYLGHFTLLSYLVIIIVIASHFTAVKYLGQSFTPYVLTVEYISTSYNPYQR